MAPFVLVTTVVEQIQIARRALRRNPEVYAGLQNFWTAMAALRVDEEYLSEEVYCAAIARMAPVMDPELEWADCMFS